MKELLLQMHKGLLWRCIKYVKRLTLLLIFLLSITYVAYAQCPNPLDPNCDYEGDPDDAVPLDDAIVWLVIAGLVLGVIFHKRHQTPST